MGRPGLHKQGIQKRVLTRYKPYLPIYSQKTFNSKNITLFPGLGKYYELSEQREDKKMPTLTQCWLFPFRWELQYYDRQGVVINLLNLLGDPLQTSSNQILSYVRINQFGLLPTSCILQDVGNYQNYSSIQIIILCFSKNYIFLTLFLELLFKFQKFLNIFQNLL